MLGLALALAAVLPPVIPDPRLGSSPWAMVDLQQPAEPPEAAGYLLPVPEKVNQEWLDRLVALAARGVPVVGLGVPGDATVIPHLDGVVVGSPLEAEAVRRCCPATALVGEAANPAEAMDKLRWGVSVWLVPGTPRWAEAVAGAFPEPQAARFQGGDLPTAADPHDLSVLVGLFPAFPGGWVELASDWVASTATLLQDGEEAQLPVEVAGGHARVYLSPLPQGGLLRFSRPLPPGGLQQVEVTARRELTLGEILARHHRQVALQNRIVSSFRGWQRLRLLVRVAELDRSFELELGGPVFFTPDLGRDWELREARVNGAAWPVEELPELPLIQPKAPPVPPLALELNPSYRYELLGPGQWEGRSVYVLAYQGGEGLERRWGRAYVDAATFGLVALEAWQQSPKQEVRRSRTVTRNALFQHEGSPLWLPWKVEGDDVVASFGSIATVHRELTLENLELNHPEVARGRAEAFRGPRPMLRERRGEVVFLEPDGAGGRREASSGGKRQSFLLGGAFWDSSLSFPLPLLGYQLLDFSWRGDQQLRLFLAGAVNDVAWSRPGTWEPRAQAFLQLVPFTESLWRGEHEVKGEALYLWRQKLRVGLARQLGGFRLGAEVGADVLHFSRTQETDPAFRLPKNTVETVAQVQALWQRGTLLAGAQWERGERLSWRRWGFGERVEPSFSRTTVFARYQRTPWPLVRFSLGFDAATSQNADRFSRFSLGGLGGGAGFVGLPGGRVHADGLAVLRASLALPLSAGQRLEVTANAGWLRVRQEGQRAAPVSGVGVTLTRRGPWGTVLEASLGLPMVAPGPNRPVVQVVLLRPWR